MRGRNCVSAKAGHARPSCASFIERGAVEDIEQTEAFAARLAGKRRETSMEKRIERVRYDDSVASPVRRRPIHRMQHDFGQCSRPSSSCAFRVKTLKAFFAF
jgi:hypothetical protein